MQNSKIKLLSENSELIIEGVQVRIYINAMMLVTFLSLSSVAKSYNRIQINVGAGIRPPFLLEDNTKGVGPDIIQTLNLIQEQFLFQLVPVPIKRRTQSLYEGWVDIMMWDNPNWGWVLDNLQLSQPLIYTKDVFVARTDKYQSKDVFDHLENHRLAMVHGYTYKFVNFETDPIKLNQSFDITLVRTVEDSINILLSGRVDIAVASNVALAWHFKKHPESKNKLLISEKYDMHYMRYFLVPDSSPISTLELDELLILADNKGLLAPIYEKYGLDKPTFKRP
jgi:ABC-type amino acid transport substrate-binding protein